MAGNTQHHDPDNTAGGVRRRHSGQHERDEMIPAEEDGLRTGSADIGPAPRPSATSPSRPTSSGNDVPVLATRSTEQLPRVRFSMDAEKRPSMADAKKTNRRRPEDPALSVNTTVAARSEEIMGLSKASSPSRVPSPSGVTSPTNKNDSPSSPTAQRGRQRGLSLRSALFQRNLRTNPIQSPGSVIEMTGVGSSRQAGLSSQATHPDTGKKSMDTIVEVSPIGHYESEEDWKSADTKSYRGVRGIAALPNYQSWIQKRASRHPAWQSIKAAYSQTRKFVLRIQEIPPTKDGRHIDLDPSTKEALIDERTGSQYISNYIRSSRYTAWNFVPRQLFAQFSKLANFYFLCVSILQMIPGLSTTGSYTTIVPLLFFVTISICKEGYDDLRRYRLDKVENNRQANVLHAYRPISATGDVEETTSSIHEGPIHWAKSKWQDIQVGDVIKLERDEAAPADMVLLNTKGANGIAYIETMALDGETNLKSKQTAPSLAKLCNSPEAITTCNAHFVVEDPNLDLYSFEGRVAIAGQPAPLTNSEIIYRGSILRNTPEAIGMVIYSGEECKIRMNANKNPRIKAPSLQTVVNRIIIVIVVFVIALSIFNTIAYQVWKQNVEDKSWYLANAGVSFFPIFTSFIIMFNTMIPLSLYVSMEIVKVAQMFLLNDIDMYDEASDTPFEARTSTINEELGQISYIFSDKTGTLTDNSMKFRKLSVAGMAWLHDADIQAQDAGEEMLVHKKRSRKSKGKKPVRKSLASVSQILEDEDVGGGRSSRKSTSQWQSSARPAKAQHELNTKEMIRYIQRRPCTVFARKARMLLLSMALCHTCLPETKDDGTIDFQAASPDELALVRAAQELDYLVIDRTSSQITIKTYPQGYSHEAVEESYEVLDVIEFSSKRKRMSVVVRFPEGRVCVMCKGADTILMQRLKFAKLANERVAMIEKRASQRKSLEAQEALARRSEHRERTSFGRPSFSLSLGSRTSAGALPRTSLSGAKRQNIRNDVDDWLKEREKDVDALHEEDVSAHYSPRPSAHITGRQSSAPSEGRISFQNDDDEEEEEELVEESLAMDEIAVVERCFQHINDFATEGLRTLLYAHRFLDEQEYAAWKKVYHDATTSLVDRQQMIEDAGELIEQELDLGGATAIEDKLQKGVPEAIEKLRRANIKMWMLTGDKRETAINIGHSCRLIKDYSSVTVLDHEAGQVESRIAATILDISNSRVAHSVIVVDGQTLAMIEEEKPLHALFLELAILADSVICCRASPSQKAGLVKSVRERVKSITLAIGDGANDIAMIQEAHVGIGITGKEGLQAARTSDYSIAQFRFLVKLLLCHGRWNYIRICKYTVGTFWKEMLFYLTQALYQRWNGYTGTSLYESWSLSMFNTLFTSLPVIFLGIFEKDLLPQTLIAVPELYTKGQRNGGFNFKIYLSWMFMASCEAMLVYFLMFGVYGETIFTKDQSLYALGSLTFTACIILIGTKLQVIEIHNKSITTIIALVLSIGGWFLWMIILAAIYQNNNEYDVKNGFFDRFGNNALWWLTLILIVVCTVWLEFGVRSLKAAYFPTDVDVFQDLERDLQIRKRFEEAAAMELQAGWHHGTKKSSFELQREEEVQVQRENEVQDLLNRPRVMNEAEPALSAVATEEETVFVEDGLLRRSTDIQEMLSRRFGSVRQGTLTSTK